MRSTGDPSWREQPIRDLLLEPAAYGANSPAVPYDPSLPRYIRITDISERGHLLHDDPRSIEANPAQGNEVRLGDLLLARSGATVGKAYLHRVQGHYAHAGYLIRLRPDPEKIESEYLFQFTQSPQYLRWVEISQRAGAQPNINATEYSSLRVPVPPIPMQRRIAEILRTWDEAIEKTERLIAAKEASLLGQMLAATRDAELGAFGKGWVRTTLGDVTDVAVRRVEWDETATYRRITVRRACGGLSLRGDALGSEILTKDMYLVKAGDFVISRRQVIHGAWAMARDEFDNTHVSKEYACLTARPGRLWMPYLDWLSRTPRLRHEALRCSYGVDPEKMVLNLDWLLKTPLALPTTIERQRKLAELLDCAQAEIALLKKQRLALARQKRGLMQKLLTGEWSVDASKLREAAE